MAVGILTTIRVQRRLLPRNPGSQPDWSLSAAFVNLASRGGLRLGNPSPEPKGRLPTGEWHGLQTPRADVAWSAVDSAGGNTMRQEAR